MLFNDPVFLFLFLPVTLLLFFGLGRSGRRSLAMAGLVGASLFSNMASIAAETRGRSPTFATLR